MNEAVLVLLGALGGILSAAATWYGARTSRRAGVAGDEREARRDEAAQRRDTIADRDALIDQMQEQLADLIPRVTRLERELEDERAYSHALLVWGLQGAPPPPPPPPTRSV